MGLPIGPPYDDIGNGCPVCFDPDTTPKYVFASFTGITIFNRAFDPGMPLPVNGTYLLTQKIGVPCEWYWIIPAVMDAWWSAHQGKATLESMAYKYFEAEQDPCDVYFTNQLHMAMPFVNGTGGHCQIAWLPKCPSPALQSIMEALNLTTQGDMKCEFWPLNADELVAMFADKTDSTCIRIKYDFT